MPAAARLSKRANNALRSRVDVCVSPRHCVRADRRRKGLQSHRLCANAISRNCLEIRPGGGGGGGCGGGGGGGGLGTPPAFAKDHFHMIWTRELFASL